MPSIEIRIPQLGEGLQEARLIRFLKQPGETVKQDEPIFEMETDKAVMEIEAPSSGVLEIWLAHEDEVLPIGAPVGRIASASDAAKAPPPVLPTPERERGAGQAGALTGAVAPATGPARNAAVPPRTRAYARQKGLSEAELSWLAQQADGKLMPEDVDRYLREGDQAARRGERESVPPAQPAPDAAPEYEDVPVPPQQRTLVYRLVRSAQAIVPATMEMPVRWEGVEAVRSRLKELSAGDEAKEASHFSIFAWCVARAAKQHPRIRSSVASDSTLRQYKHLHLAVAVARPGDELLMARVPNADALDFDQFVATARDAIRRAREGQDQASEAMQLILTNMAGAGVRRGVPVAVAPAAGTLFIGEAYDEAYPLPGGGVGFRRMASMALTFDHRVLNGMGAAAFLTDVRVLVENVRNELAERLA